MARNGAGIYVLPPGQPVVTGAPISSTTFNTLTTDLANALTTSVSSDGQTPMTGPLQMAGNKLTGLGAATVLGDSVRYEQVGGIGQAWQNVTASRAAGVSYTNLTTKPITIYINVVNTASTGSFGLSINVDAVTFISYSGVAGMTATTLVTSSGQITIPPNSAYQVTLSNSTIFAWLELR